MLSIARVRTRRLAAVTVTALMAVITAAGGVAHSRDLVNASDVSADETSIRRTLESYSAALNDADLTRILSVYTEDGVVLAPNNPTAVGKEAVAGAYKQAFSAVKFNLKFPVAEILRIAPSWAVVRSNSAGTVTLQPSGTTVPAAFQELFVFQKAESGTWRIARYSFSSTTPPP